MPLTLVVLAAILPARQFAIQSVDNRLECADVSNGLMRFINYPTGASNDKFVPNPSFWAKDVDFSCASPWNSSGGALRAGTLISKRHIVFAKHFPISVGARVVFVGTDGEVCACYLDACKTVGNSDITVGLLNAEVTPNIHPAKILPQNFKAYLRHGENLPVATFNQKEELVVTDLQAIPTNHAPFRVICTMKPKGTRRLMFRRQIVGGDSGNPAFLIFGIQPVLLYCLLGGGYGSGSAINAYRDEIQCAMDELCRGYKLETIDFSTTQ